VFMIRSQEELRKSIPLAVNQTAVLFAHIILAIVAGAHTLITPGSHGFDRIAGLALI
jgi:hypothetical protein